MHRYYTRVCNFYYGNRSKLLIDKKKSLPLNGSKEISFDHVEIISRKSRKMISIKNLNSLSKTLKKKIILDLKKIISKKKILLTLNFKKYPI